MHKTRKLSMVLVFVLLVLSPCFVAGTPIPPVTYSLYFEKAPKNTFYFSDPANPTVEYSSAAAGGGIQFTLPDTGKEGAPSTASIGIYYNLESTATINVWFNSSINKDDTYRLKVPTDPPSYLNFLIGIGNNEAEALADLQANPDYATFDGGLPVVEAKNPVITIHSYTSDPGTGEKNVFYENKGSKVMALFIKQPKLDGSYTEYMGGQYKGYVIMDLITT